MVSETKTCINCSKEKLIEDFPFFSTKEAGRKNTCKNCSRRLTKIRKTLRASNPPPEAGPCPICGKHTEKWVLDHCHFINVFRGYICNRCNLGLGNFNDDIKLLKNAVDYLDKPVRLNYKDIMDYILVYKNKDGEKMAAIPDVEGVYKNEIDFPEYEEDMTSIEVVILEAEDINSMLGDPDDGLYFTAVFAGKYVSSQKIYKCVEKLGFEKFFTTVIKDFIK